MTTCCYECKFDEDCDQHCPNRYETCQFCAWLLDVNEKDECPHYLAR